VKITIEVPDFLVKLFGSEENLKREIEALIKRGCVDVIEAYWKEIQKEKEKHG